MVPSFLPFFLCAHHFFQLIDTFGLADDHQGVVGLDTGVCLLG